VRSSFALVAIALVGCQLAPEESTTQQASVVINPSSFDFGRVQLGSTSTVHTVTVAPGPLNQDDTVTAVTANCPDFDIQADGLPAHVFRVCGVVTCLDAAGCPNPNITAGRTDPTSDVICQTVDIGRYTFDTVFHPRVVGQVSCVVSVRETDNANGGINTRTVTLTGTGEAPPVNADISPTSVAFGDVRRNTDSTQAQIKLSSTGSMALSVSSVTITPGFLIKAGPTGAFTLPPNASQTYPIACHPTALGGMTGQLVVTSNDPDQPMINVALTCKGIDSNLDISPSPAALPPTRVGEPIDGSLMLTNSGTLPMKLENVALSGTGITMMSSPSPGTMLSAGGSVDVSVHFEATDKGDASATLTATYDGGQTRKTEITARALPTSLALTPDGDVDFGPVCGGKTRTQDFMLIANDLGSFKLSSITRSSPPFTLTAPALPVTVQGSGANQVHFQITAAPTSADTFTAPVVVHTDIPGGADHTLRLVVQGLPAGVTATPDTIDLGSNPINTTTIGQEVHLTNCGVAPIAFSNPRIEGDNALDFAIVQQPSASMIAPAAAASWLIVLQAHSVGVKQARFAVDYDGGKASVALLGEGLGDAAPKDHRGSYYACSTGSAAGLAPLGLVLALLLRRRRAG
jgi:MYXO-CTERM domain-containing protein